ncbi:YHS domain-containing (seleno)protein [Glaciecola petra]|uniref:YHS domain-containing (Seleno)protein n=1 Tax=Glaciecola petra TaxID=3075602 RepID=A0ABU2ZUL9_9ALTE|nr:YHS domain-containing (seleno)protein [Aestuariibacter sp. P117]MDT0596339.1 YHS domain-containing (seleno)protein [Aestuariibacter sp. P117]
MRIFTLLILLVSSTVAFANAPVETGTFNNKAIYGYDTVAYWTDNKARKGIDEFVYTWRGAQWHFVSAENKALFVADPEKYAPQYGGYCAFGMANDKLVSIDEDAFQIYKGKLYLNYSKRVAERFNEDLDYFIAEADRIYPEKVDLNTK